MTSTEIQKLEIQKLRKELENLKSEFSKNKQENIVKSNDFPELKKTHKHRGSKF